LSNYFIRVVFKGLYIRSRFTINPDKVYRMAMTRLNTSAGILEVMGAPLSGTELRAYIMSGGGLTLKKFKPGIRSKRCFLIFPIRGSEKKGLVNVEVKKKNGQVNKFYIRKSLYRICYFPRPSHHCMSRASNIVELGTFCCPCHENC